MLYKKIFYFFLEGKNKKTKKTKENQKKTNKNQRKTKKTKKRKKKNKKRSRLGKNENADNSTVSFSPDHLSAFRRTSKRKKVPPDKFVYGCSFSFEICFGDFRRTFRRENVRFRFFLFFSSISPICSLNKKYSGE